MQVNWNIWKCCDFVGRECQFNVDTGFTSASVFFGLQKAAVELHFFQVFLFRFLCDLNPPLGYNFRFEPLLYSKTMCKFMMSNLMVLFVDKRTFGRTSVKFNACSA